MVTQWVLPCEPVDGMDPTVVYPAMQEAIDRARKGDGPTLLEMRTYRYKGHSMSDAQNYRTKDEVAEFQKRDPIGIVQKIIQDKNYANEEYFKDVDKRVKDMVAECVKFAEESDFPAADNLYKNVYSQEDYPFVKTH
jgi:pyruvate dehydrogenase E1 component alpha subunit